MTPNKDRNESNISKSREEITQWTWYNGQFLFQFDEQLKKRYLFLLIIILGQVSCNNKKLTIEPSNGIDSIHRIDEKIEILTEAEFINLFKKRQQEKYDIRNDMDLIVGIQKSYDFWTSKKLLINDTLKRIEVWGYPLSFKEVNSEIKWLTSVGEGENNINIRLFTLDKNYNTVDVASITSSGGDEGIGSWSVGEFKNDSTYLLTTFVTGYETDSIESTYHTCLIIHSNGEIEKIENSP